MGFNSAFKGLNLFSTSWIHTSWYSYESNQQDATIYTCTRLTTIYTCTRLTTIYTCTRLTTHTVQFQLIQDTSNLGEHYQIL